MFRTYEKAHDHALDIANREQRDVGLEKNTAFGYTQWMVRRLPRPENRTGHELRVQVISPTCSKGRWKEIQGN